MSDSLRNRFVITKEPAIKSGCCGFRSSREKYFGLLSLVEIQHTFYQPPQINTLMKWRAEAPAKFEFTIKAWQLITHESRSPTYRRLKKQLSVEELRDCGSFKPTPIVKEAWGITQECAAALAAKCVLFQCPASFIPSNENIENLHQFFTSIKREGLKFCWEPRGGWPKELVRQICDNLDLVHVVDPFSDTTATPDFCYYRLHGRKGFRYKYEDSELEELLSMLPKGKASYILFNNVHMIEDAVRFQEIVNEHRED